MHIVNGAVAGLVFWALFEWFGTNAFWFAIAFAMVEHLVTYPLTLLTDRFHPARGARSCRRCRDPAAPSRRRPSAISSSASSSACSSRSDERHGLSTARRGPARKPASTSRAIASVSATGRPSNRSTARRFACRHAPSPRAHPERVAATPPRAHGAARGYGRHARRRGARHRRGARRARRRPGRHVPRPVVATAGPRRTAEPGPPQRARAPLFRSEAELAQPLHGSGKRELRAAEALDEVPSPAAADRLESPELSVDGAVAPGMPSARTPSRTMILASRAGTPRARGDRRRSENIAR